MQVDLAELETSLQEAAATTLDRIIREALADATARIAARARDRVRTQFTQRSRSLLLSIRHEMTADGLTGVVSAGGQVSGLDVPYARLHEYGGHIVPVRATLLTIPTGAGLTGPGIPRYSSVRDMPFAKWIPIRGRRKLRFLVVDSRNGELYYFVVTDSTIPARPYLRPSLREVVETLPAELAAAAGEAVLS